MQKAFKDFADLWLGCFGHNLNLAITKVLKIRPVEDAVWACRHTIQGFTRSWKRKRDFKSKQVILGLPEKSLIHDVVTRWGSTFVMERFLSHQQAVSAALAGERGAWHLMPKDLHITIMEQVCDLLRPLNVLTDALLSEKRVTISAIKPILVHIKSQVLQQCDGDQPLVRDEELDEERP